MNNVFEDLAAANATRPMQVKLRRIAKQPMVPTEREKKQYDKQKQMQLFKRWKREIRQGLVEGIYGPEIIMLLRFLRKVPEPEALIAWIKGSKWLLEGESIVKQNVMSYINSTLERWYIRHGEPPFNDSLWDEPDSPSVTIFKLLRTDSDVIPAKNTRR